MNRSAYAVNSGAALHGKLRGAEIVEVEGDVDPVVSDEDDLDDDDEDDGSDIQARLQLRTFVVASKALAKQPNWVSVMKVFGGATDRELLQRAGVKDFNDPRFEMYTERLARLRAIKGYMYVMQVLGREMSYEEVAEIFVRVNSLGMKLRGSDLALAQISAKWRGCLELLEDYQEACERASFTLDTGLLVRTMMVFATKQPKFARVGTTPVEDLKQGWEESKLGLDYAIDFLRKNAGIEDETLLSSPVLMIMVAVFSHMRKQKLTREESQALLYWLHVANARGRYSRGSAETLLAEDLNILFRGGSAEDLLEPMKRLFSRLDIAPSDLAGRPSRSPLFPLAYLALKARGAKDWETGLGIALGMRGRQHVVQYHHIFPKAVLREAGYEMGEDQRNRESRLRRREDEPADRAKATRRVLPRGRAASWG